MRLFEILILITLLPVIGCKVNGMVAICIEGFGKFYGIMSGIEKCLFLGHNSILIYF